MPRGQEGNAGVDRQVAVANSTVAAFLRGRQPSWVVNGKLATPRPRTVPTVTQAGSSQKPVTVGAVQALTLPPQEVWAEVDQSVLPSPAPSNEPSPLLPNPRDRPNLQRATAVSGGSEAPPTAQNTSIRLDGTQRRRPSQGYTSAMADRSQPINRGEEPSFPSAAYPTPTPNDGNTGALRYANADSTPGSTTGFSMPATYSRDPQAKRRRTGGSFISAPSPQEDADFVAPVAIPAMGLASFLPRIEALVDSLGGEQALSADIEYPRVKLITDACKQEDGFFIALHQLFAVWALRPTDAHSYLGIEAGVVDSAFHLIEQILKKNDKLPQAVLSWFAQFPLPLPTLLADAGSAYRRVVDLVAVFLQRFSGSHEQLVVLVQHRQYPPLVDELLHGLCCYSPLLQWNLFTASRRRLGVQDGPIARRMNALFKEDQRRHRSSSGGFIAVPPQSMDSELAQSNMNNAALGPQYLALVRQNQELGRQNQVNQNQTRRTQGSAVSPTWPVHQSPGPGTGQTGNVQSHGRKLSSAAISPTSFIPMIAQAQMQDLVAAQAHNALQAGRYVTQQNLQQSQQPPRQQPANQDLRHQSQAAAAAAGPIPTNSTPLYSPRETTGLAPNAGTIPRHMALPTQPQGGFPLQLVDQARFAQWQAQAQAQPNGQWPQGQPMLSVANATAPNMPNQGMQVIPGAAMPFAPSVPLQHFAASPQSAIPGPSNNPLGSPAMMMDPPASSPYVIHPFYPYPQQLQLQQPLPPGQQQEPLREPAPLQQPQPEIRAPMTPQQAFHPAPLLPRPGLVIFRSEMPYSPNEDKAVLMSLHQAHVRSPPRVPRRTPGAEKEERYYQAIKSLPLEPTPVTPQNYVYDLDFMISDEEFVMVPKMERLQGSVFSAAEYSSGSLRWRLRCCAVPAAAKQISEADWAVMETAWPEHIHALLNGKVLTIRRASHNSKDLPVELTSFVQPGRNLLRVVVPVKASTNSRPPPCIHVLAVETVETRSHSDLTARIWEKGILAETETIQKIRTRLGRDTAADGVSVALDKLSIDVADPFSATLFQTPVRGVACVHMECFDLETWLTTRPASKPSVAGKCPLHRSKAKSGDAKPAIGERFCTCDKPAAEPSHPDKWKCPICGADARPNSLRIDSFLLGVRKELTRRGQAQVKSVLVGADGKWEPVVEMEGEGDESDDDVIPPGRRRRKSAVNTATTTTRAKEPVIIEID